MPLSAKKCHFKVFRKGNTVGDDLTVVTLSTTGAFETHSGLAGATCLPHHASGKIMTVRKLGTRILDFLQSQDSFDATSDSLLAILVIERIASGTGRPLRETISRRRSHRQRVKFANTASIKVRFSRAQCATTGFMCRSNTTQRSRHAFM